MIRTQIQLTEKQSRILKQMALERSVSVAALIRQSVDALIRRRSDVDREEQRRRALSIIGAFSSSVDDLSENHDRYLDTAYSGSSHASESDTS